MGKIGRKKPWLPATQFKKGHPYLGSASGSGSQNESLEDNSSSLWLPRLTQEDFNLVVIEDGKGRFTLPDADGVCSGGKILRPKQQENSDSKSVKYLDGNGDGEYRILHREKTINLMNVTITNHHETMGEICKVPQFTINSERQKGLCWLMSLKCTNCEFEGPVHKLYEEIELTERGPKYAKPNLALQVALQDSSIGNAKARLILLSANIPAPSESGMQKAANRVGKLTSQNAEKDLNSRCSKVLNVNEMRNHAKNSGINISFDARYNSTSIVSKNKMGQSATQAIAIAVEQSTNEKQIIGMCMENKLCHQGALLRSKGQQISCPGHDGCTANKKMMEPFSEYEMGLKLGRDLAEQQVMVKHCITDGDGRGSDGIDASMKQIDPLWQVIRQADTTHLGQSQFRRTNKTVFSKDMFPGSSKDLQNEQRKMLALDLKHRTHLIFHNMYTDMSGDIDAIARKMPTVIECTIDCYSGNHTMCRQQAVVCQGGKNNWLSKSLYLTVCEATNLTPDDNDRKLLRDLLRFYLGPSSLPLLKLNRNTNKNEAVNRALSASLPKNVHFARNAKPRAFSAICRLNKGHADAIIDSVEAVGCTFSKGGRVARGLHTLQGRSRYQRLYAKSEARRRAKTMWRCNNIREYFRCKELRKKADYKKGQLDPRSGGGHKVHARSSTEGQDHSYSLRPFTRRFDHQYFKQ